MNKYERAKKELEEIGICKMKAFGNSMLPKIKSGSLLTFKKQETYEIGDIVFSKVKSHFIDAHQITKKDQKKGYLISNNKGWDNGWTKTIYGRVIQAEINGEVKNF
jgi:SOS-response transcriptional repressor LexA